MKTLSKNNALFYKVRHQLKWNTWVNLILEGSLNNRSRERIIYLSFNNLSIEEEKWETNKLGTQAIHADNYNECSL